MILNIQPGMPLRGEVTLPGDKSISHRAALFAALAAGRSRIENFLDSGVTRAMLNALSDLGVHWQLQGTTLTVEGRGLQGLRSPEKPLNCGNSATTLRLLAGALAASGIPAVLDGSASLRSRPMLRIVDPLRQMGVQIDTNQGAAPIHLLSFQQQLKALNYHLPVASAQVKTCLILAALAADGPSTLVEPALSRDHTERMLQSMGVSIRSDRMATADGMLYRTVINPAQCCPLTPLNVSLPGDFSSAAFLIVAAAVTPGSEIKIHRVGLNSARTGLLDALLAMGADIHIASQAKLSGEPIGDLTVKYSPLVATQIHGEQVVRMIDEFPAFAIAASFARGISTVKDAAELRVKESDRISALCAELGNIGVETGEEADGFSVHGSCHPRGGTIQTHNDHRLALALAAAGLASQEAVTIPGAEIIEESFPGYIKTLQDLGAQVQVI